MLSSRSLCLFVASALLLAGCKASVSTTDTPIVIGSIRSLTGAASVYGDPASKATVLAVDEINAAGGILGRQVKLIVEDGLCEGRPTVSATNKLIDSDGVHIIFGGTCSTESLTIAPITNAKGVLQMATLTSSNDYTDAGPLSFRTYPSSSFYDAKLGTVAFEKGAKKIAALHEQKDFPTSAYESFAKAFTAAGGEVISTQQFPSSERDLRTYLAKVKDSGADAIYFGAQGPQPAILFFRQLHELGMDTFTVFANNQGVTPDIYRDTQGLLNDHTFTVTPYLDPQSEKASAYLTAYAEAHGAPPPNNPFFSASAYDSVFMVKEAMEHCNSDTDVQCMATYLTTLKGWQGAGGSYTFDDNGDVTMGLAVYSFNKDGKEIYAPVQ